MLHHDLQNDFRLTENFKNGWKQSPVPSPPSTKSAGTSGRKLRKMRYQSLQAISNMLDIQTLPDFFVDFLCNSSQYPKNFNILISFISSKPFSNLSKVSAICKHYISCLVQVKKSHQKVFNFVWWCFSGRTFFSKQKS